MPVSLTEEEKEKRRAYYRQHRSDYVSRGKKWQAKNLERRREIGRKSYQKNKTKYKEYARQYRLKNPERWHEIHLRSRRKCQERIRAYAKRYCKEHPEVFVAAAQKRRALEKTAQINLSKMKMWMGLVRSQDSAVCYYCQRETPTAHIHFDHIIPLSKGGAHSIENLCVSCAHCNATKSNKELSRWIKVGQQLLGL